MHKDKEWCTHCSFFMACHACCAEKKNKEGKAAALNTAKPAARTKLTAKPAGSNESADNAHAEAAGKVKSCAHAQSSLMLCSCPMISCWLENILCALMTWVLLHISLLCQVASDCRKGRLQAGSPPRRGPRARTSRTWGQRSSRHVACGGIKHVVNLLQVLILT